MMLEPKNKLVKAFLLATTVLASASALFPIQNAEADMDVYFMATLAATAAHDSSEMRDKEVTNAAIANPSEQSIQELQKRRLVTAEQVPYIRDSIRDMKLPQDVKSNQITAKQRQIFKDGIKHKQQAAIAAAPTSAEAVGKGLGSGLAPYFNLCKANPAVSPAKQAGDPAENLNQCMKDNHWEKDTKPVLKVLGGGAGALALAGAVALSLHKRKRKIYDFT